MTSETHNIDPQRSRMSNRFRALWTQENVITIIVSLIVAIAVVLPLITLVCKQLSSTR
jgi:ABC-type lipoprotein release transport system permease subunit